MICTSWLIATGCGPGETESLASPASGKAEPISQLRIGPDDQLDVIDIADELDRCFGAPADPRTVYAFVLFVDQVVPNTATVYKTRFRRPVDTGHAFVMLERTLGTDTQRLVFGFHPLGAIDFYSMDAQGVISRNGDYHYDISLRFPLSKQQFDALVTRFRELGEPTFNLAQYNCVNYAISSDAALGVRFPRTEASWMLGWAKGLAPAVFGQDLRSWSLPAGVTRDASGGNAPQSRCPEHY